MYRQINPTETFRERQLALLREAENRRLARRLRARRTPPKARSTIAAIGFLVALVVASLMLVALGSSAQASTTFTVNSSADFADINPAITAAATKNSTLDTSEFSTPRKVVSS